MGSINGLADFILLEYSDPVLISQQSESKLDAITEFSVPWAEFERKMRVVVWIAVIGTLVIGLAFGQLSEQRREFSEAFTVRQ